MDSQQIASKLREKHQSFTNYISSLDESSLIYESNGKWSAGQQLDHIIRGVSAVKMALTLPKFIPKLIFGSANRASRSYEQLVQKYQNKLASGGKASGRFLPSKVAFDQRDDLIKKLSNLVEGLNKRVEKLSETDFEEYVLPHPILGKLTIREMLYFTIYHVQHHHKNAIRNLERN